MGQRGRPMGSKNKPKENKTKENKLSRPRSFDDISNEFLTANEVGYVLRFHPQKIRQMARDKEIPAHRVGDTWRFIKSEIKEWLMKEAS